MRLLAGKECPHHRGYLLRESARACMPRSQSATHVFARSGSAGTGAHALECEEEAFVEKHPDAKHSATTGFAVFVDAQVEKAHTHRARTHTHTRARAHTHTRQTIYKHAPGA